MDCIPQAKQHESLNATVFFGRNPLAFSSNSLYEYFSQGHIYKLPMTLIRGLSRCPQPDPPAFIMPVTKLELGTQHGDVMVRHSELAWGMGALVFIHGLGESRQLFIEAFEHEGFEHYNLFAPDLPGFGNSPGGIEHTLTDLLQCLEKIILHFNIPECILVGHGMGADLACWLAQRSLGQDVVKGVINVEGTFGETSLKYADMAINAADDPARTFQKWFQFKFLEETILQPYLGKEPAYRRFYESLKMCRPSAFLNLAREMRETLYMDEKQGIIQASHTFKSLHVPRMYCLGARGLNTDYVPELDVEAQPYLLFKDSTHWPMLDEPLAFYHFLLSFSRKHMPPRPHRERMKAYFQARFRNWLDKLPNTPKKLAEKIQRCIHTRWKRKIR